MNILKVYFTKERLFLEAVTQIKPLFFLLVIAACLWALTFLLAYVLGTAEEAPIQLIDRKESDPNIRAGLIISNFANFDINRGEFVAEGSIWFDFDKKHYSAQDFSTFRFQRGEFLTKTEPSIKEMGAVSRATFGFTTKIKSKIDYANFPLDKHRFDFIVMDVLKDKPRSIPAKNLSLFVDPHAIEHGWRSFDTETRSGFAVLRFEDNHQAQIADLGPRMIFSLFVERDSPKTPVLVFMPLLLIFFIGLISLSFDVLENFNAILSLSVGSLTGFLFFRSVIDRLMPLPDQFTIADKVYLLMISLTVVILGIQIYILHYFRKLQNKTSLTQLIAIQINNMNILRGCFFILLIISLLVATIAMFF